MTIESIRSFLRINPNLATAGQPSEEQIRALADEGFQHIINLGLMDPRYALPDEAGLVQSLGMRYTHIPVQFDTPDDNSLQLFYRAMDQRGEERTLVHCAANYRVSCFMALYGMRSWQWNRDHAKRFVAQVWSPNEVWTAFMDAHSRVAVNV